MERKKLVVNDDVKLHIEKMIEVLAGSSDEINYTLETGGCGEQCKVTCAYYCRAACEGNCQGDCKSFAAHISHETVDPFDNCYGMVWVWMK